MTYETTEIDAIYQAESKLNGSRKAWVNINLLLWHSILQLEYINKIVNDSHVINSVELYD